MEVEDAVPPPIEPAAPAAGAPEEQGDQKMVSEGTAVSDLC
jgi:hypothetical protein